MSSSPLHGMGYRYRKLYLALVEYEPGVVGDVVGDFFHLVIRPDPCLAGAREMSGFGLCQAGWPDGYFLD